MRAEQIAEDFPVVRSDSDAIDAVRLIAEHRLAGLVITDPSGRPLQILPASEVVRLLLPAYIQDDPALAGVIGELNADRVAEKLSGKSIAEILPKTAAQLASVSADDTIIEVAAVMARERSPLAAVVTDGRLIGVITASRLLDVALGNQ
ncbi:MAG: CBS domain-containing protein [Mycobacterium sp.]|nr:CBS domain-containing protein [Mycobacterium sp.]